MYISGEKMLGLSHFLTKSVSAIKVCYMAKSQNNFVYFHAFNFQNMYFILKL